MNKGTEIEEELLEAKEEDEEKSQPQPQPKDTEENKMREAKIKQMVTQKMFKNVVSKHFHIIKNAILNHEKNCLTIEDIKAQILGELK
jgi:hypothetical protein